MSNTQKGAALITSLWIALILLILGLAYLSILSADYHFSSREEQKVKAFYLARSGMEYYASRQSLPPEDPVTKEHRLYLPPGQTTEYCVISPDPVSGGYRYTGTIARSDGVPLVKRTLVTSGGDIYTWYERSE